MKFYYKDIEVYYEVKGKLEAFGIIPDEGYFGDHESGNYGPYVQSQRADIYKVVIKYMLENNMAYPCFCSAHDPSIPQFRNDYNNQPTRHSD